MENKIGRKIYYDRFTGNVLIVTCEIQGEGLVETTLAEDFQSYIPLQQRTIDSVGVIKLDYGQFSDKFNTSKSYSVDISQEITDASSIIFNIETQTQIPIPKSNSEDRLSALEKSNAELMSLIAMQGMATPTT